MVRPCGRRGFVLVVAILLLLVVTALAHAALVLGRTHRRAGGWMAMARARQWSAVALVRERAASLDSLRDPLGDDPPWGRATVRILSPEVALLTARVDSAGAGVSAAALVWALDPSTRVAALPGAAEVGRRPDAATYDAIVVGPTESCPPGAAVPDPGPWVREVAWGGAAEAPLTLGLLEPNALEERLEAILAPSGTPGPSVEDGACGAGPWNWGALEPDDSPCRHRYVGKAAAADLELQGGEGQGVLLVRGTLRLEGTRFRGLILVGGDVVLTDGARVEGVARVGGALRIEGGHWVPGSCAAFRALEAVQGLGRPRVLPGAGWIAHGT